MGKLLDCVVATTICIPLGFGLNFYKNKDYFENQSFTKSKGETFYVDNKCQGLIDFHGNISYLVSGFDYKNNLQVDLLGDNVYSKNYLDSNSKLELTNPNKINPKLISELEKKLFECKTKK